MTPRILSVLFAIFPLFARAAEPFDESFMVKFRLHMLLALVGVIVLMAWLYLRNLKNEDERRREQERRTKAIMHERREARNLFPRHQLPLDFEGDTIPIDDGFVDTIPTDDPFPHTIAIGDAPVTTPAALMVEALPDVDGEVGK